MYFAPPQKKKDERAQAEQAGAKPQKKAQSALALPVYLGGTPPKDEGAKSGGMPLYLREHSEYKKSGADSGSPIPEQAAVDRALEDQSPGQPLDFPLRAELEARLGQPLEDVRVHTSHHASSLAKGLGAEAFTRGLDIYFEEGRFQPSHPDGRKLLVHELAHTAQNRSEMDSGRRSSPIREVSRPSDPAEREADAFGEIVGAGGNIAPHVFGEASPAPLARRSAQDLPAPIHRPDQEPEDPVEATANAAIELLLGDPQDEAGGVRRRLSHLGAAQQAAVLERLEESLPPETWASFESVMNEAPPAGGEEAPAPPEIAPTDPYQGNLPPGALAEGGGAEAGDFAEAEAGEAPVEGAEGAEAAGPEEGEEGAEEAGAEAAGAPGGEGGGEEAPEAEAEGGTGGGALPASAPAGETPVLPALDLPADVLALPPEARKEAPPAVLAGMRTAVGARTSQFRSRVAFERSRLRMLADDALSQLGARIAGERERVASGAQEARSMLSQSYADARTQASELFNTAIETLSAQVEAQKARVLEKEAAEIGRLQGESAALLESLASAGDRYDEGATAVGEEEAERAENESEALASQAESRGQARAGAATGAESLRAMKSEALTEIGGETAGHIRSTGEEAAQTARDGASEALGAFQEQAVEASAQADQIVEQALSGLPELSAPVLGRLDQALAEALPQFEEALGQVLGMLDEAETESLGAVDAAESGMLAQLDQTEAEGGRTIESQFASTDAQLEEQQRAVESALGAADPAVPDAFDTLASMTEQTLSGYVDAFAEGLSAGQAAIDQSIGEAGNAFEAGLSSAEQSAGEQIQQLLSGLESNLGERTAAATEAFEQEVGGYEANVELAVNQTLASLEAMNAEMDSAIEESLSDLREKIGAGVDEAMAHNQEEFGALEGSGKFDEAELLAENEYNKGFWEKVWDTFLRALLIGLLVFVLPLVIIGVIFGAKVAAIVGLIALAVFAVISIGTRFYRLWKEGAPWYNWMIYIVRLPIFLVLDLTGLGGIIEGAIGYDIVTWRKLSEDEAAERMGTGLAGLVLLIATLGFGRFAPKSWRTWPGLRGRGAGPRTGPGEPPGVKPPEVKPPEVKPPEVKPPEVKPPGTGGGTSQRLGIDMGQLEPVPSPNGRCFKPQGGQNPSAAEVSLGDRIATARGEDLVFPKTKNQAAIDGFYRTSEQPVQLKTLTGSAKGQSNKMVTRANDAFDATTANGWSNVDVHIEAPLMTKAQALARWTQPGRLPSLRDMSGDAIGKITVHCSDGPIELPIPGRDMPVPPGGTPQPPSPPPQEPPPVPPQEPPPVLPQVPPPVLPQEPPPEE